MKGFSDLWVPPRYFQNFHLFYQYQEDKILNVRKFSIIIYVLTIPICHMYLYLLYYLAWKEYHHTKSHRCVQRRGRVEDKSRYHHRHHHHCSVCLHVWRLLRKFNILNDFVLLLLSVFCNLVHSPNSPNVLMFVHSLISSDHILHFEMRMGRKDGRLK